MKSFSSRSFNIIPKQLVWHRERGYEDPKNFYNRTESKEKFIYPLLLSVHAQMSLSHAVVAFGPIAARTHLSANCILKSLPRGMSIIMDAYGSKLFGNLFLILYSCVQVFIRLQGQ